MRWFLFAAIAAATSALPACQSAGPASDLPARPNPHLIRSDQPATLRVPADEPLSIVFSNAQRQAGPGGKADSDAAASKDGSGNARAEITSGGKAAATFQLGHAVRNETSRQLDIDFAIRYRYEFDAAAESVPGVSEATLALDLFARDAANRLLRKIDLLKYTTADGSAARQGEETLRTTLTLGPGDVVNLFIAGSANVDTERSGRSAKATLNLSKMEFEIATRPAPAVPKTETRQAPAAGTKP